MYQDCKLSDQFAAGQSPASIVPLFSWPLVSRNGGRDQPLAQPAPPVHVALIGTYAPRKCGIATFTTDLVEQLAAHQPQVTTAVYALDSADQAGRYAAPVQLFEQDRPAAYRETARAINASGADAVWLQHEFGIFGGPDGELVCELVDHLAAPLIITFHTVLSQPSANQRRIVLHLLSRAERIMVMSQHGRELLLRNYGADADRVEVIAHGAPDRPFGREDEFKQQLGLSGQNVLMTFGLLGPGKGLEQVISALPAIVARYPDTLYRIVGATHPTLAAREGEAYREGLIALADRLGVARHIGWENSFLDTPQLLDQIEACDIYITPYINLQQATSGTLSYAVALGKAVVSTPYVHARELLAGGVGVLVPPASSAAIADAVIALLADRGHLTATRQRAYAAGRATIWPQFAQATAALVQRATARPVPAQPLIAPLGREALRTRRDAASGLRHPAASVPDRRHG